MNKLKKYHGLFLLLAVFAVIVLVGFVTISPLVAKYVNNNSEIETKTQEQTELLQKKKNIEEKKKRLRNNLISAQKAVYSPVESDLDNDTLFFNLYSDLLEMIHSNSIKIKNIDYSYSPETDKFVADGGDAYFVCDVNMDLISNFVNIGRFIQDIYQYPYYIKINGIEILPYEKDKKVLFSKVSLRLYAHTTPTETILNGETEKDSE